MAQPTLFAQLAARFAAQPERLAAEALAFLLASSVTARAAVVDLCAIPLPALAARSPELRFSSPASHDEYGVNGVVGADRAGAARLIVDGRFWSALPPDQPVRALRHLTMRGDGALLVLAPAGRFTSLWAELRRRCRLAGLPVHGDHTLGDPVRWTRVAERQALILTTWGALLAGVRARLVANGDQETVAEVDRLAALCEQLDANAFLPLSASELAAVSPRRLTQLFTLVDDLARNCTASGLCGLEQQAAISRPGYLGVDLTFGTVTLHLCVSVERWATLRETPFWLLVYDAARRPARGVETRLAPLASEIPPRLLRDGETGAPLIPLFPPLGVDREAVLSELERQISTVARLLGEGPTSEIGASR